MKKYPFATRKYAHDVDLCYYIAFNNDDYENVDKLIELRCAISDTFDGRVSWLTGKQIHLAKQCISIAQERRA